MDRREETESHRGRLSRGAGGTRAGAMDLTARLGFVVPQKDAKDHKPQLAGKSWLDLHPFLSLFHFSFHSYWDLNLSSVSSD